MTPSRASGLDRVLPWVHSLLAGAGVAGAVHFLGPQQTLELAATVFAISRTAGAALKFARRRRPRVSPLPLVLRSGDMDALEDMTRRIRSQAAYVGTHYHELANQLTVLFADLEYLEEHVKRVPKE